MTRSPAKLRAAFRSLVVATILAIVAVSAAHTDETDLTALPVLARIGPWPTVSGLVAYDGRLWFANSVKGRDHNSADIYSLEPADGTVRYERHLWSQDAGIPLVANGLLYWPYEDALVNGGWGTFDVTNGRDWATGLVPTEDIFHIHDMAAIDGCLYAATSAFSTGLQASDDGGKTWTTIYAHPTPDTKLRRIIRLAVIGDTLVGTLRAPEGRTVLAFYGDHVTTPTGWPTGRRVSDLVALEGWLYGFVNDETTSDLWRTDGLRVEHVAGPIGDWQAVDLASDGERLWALSREADGGAVWTSDDGTVWQPVATLSGGRPRDLLIIAGAPFVAGSGDDGQGIIWGRPGVPFPAGMDPPPALPDILPLPYEPVDDWAAAAERLDALLADPAAYDDVGLVIDELTYNLAYSDPPDGFFEARLDTPRPTGSRDLFRDVTVENIGDIGHFLLLRAMGFARQGRIDPAVLAAPWTTPENDAQKYYAPLVAALAATGQLGQNDPQTIAVLVERLSRENDPLWLKGLVIGTLHDVTGERFGYDIDAWTAWAAAQP